MTTATGVALGLRQSYAFFSRNFNLMKRYWGWEVVWLAYTLANSMAVTFIASGAEAVTGQTNIDVAGFTLYLLIGTLVWHYLSVIFGTISEIVAWERWEGTIEYTLMAPVSRWVHLLGQTIFAVVYAFLTTILIGAAMAVFFRLDLSQANLPGALSVLLLGSLSLIGVGIVASILPLLYPERGAQMTNVVQAVFLLVSGVYAPISVLPGWMQPLALISPPTYVLNGVRAALIDGAPFSALRNDLLVLLLMGVVCVPAGIQIFKLAERYAKRAGVLKRVG